MSLRLVEVAPVVDDMPEATYHARPELSSSGARKLLPPSCPAIFDHERRHPPESTPVFDFGSAAHKLVLGDGPEVAVIAAPDWRSKGARDERDAARAAGMIPVLGHQWVEVQAMAEAIRVHPVAGPLFDGGRSELSLFWRDQRSGVDCRARLDHLTENVLGETVAVDYKTTRSADPRSLQRSIATYGYHCQEAWYRAGIEACDLGADPSFLFVFQEKTPPYPVTVVALATDAVAAGAERNRVARSIFAECEATGVWPAYSDELVRITLPDWAYTTEEEDLW